MIVQSQDAVIPLYHIFVRMNCFIPSSYITTLSRGDTEYGEEVGHFEYVWHVLRFSPTNVAISQNGDINTKALCYVRRDRKSHRLCTSSWWESRCCMYSLTRLYLYST